MLLRGLTSLLVPVENKASSAAKPPAGTDAGAARPGTGPSPAIAGVGLVLVLVLLLQLLLEVSKTHPRHSKTP